MPIWRQNLKILCARYLKKCFSYSLYIWHKNWDLGLDYLNIFLELFCQKKKKKKKNYRTLLFGEIVDYKLCQVMDSHIVGDIVFHKQTCLVSVLI